MAKPNPSSDFQMSLPNQSVSFDADAFDDAIRNHGVTLVHYRAMRCPVGMIDPYDIRKPHADHEGCSNGFIYTLAGEVSCLFMGNSAQNITTDLGMATGASVQVTMPRTYDGTETPIEVATFDRLYLAEESIAVPHWQLVEAHATGMDRLSFPAVAVTDLVDSQGNRYGANDYAVRQGQIQWLGQHRPGMDPSTSKGRIYSIRFTYRPYWYIKTVVHEVRVAQSSHPITGERQVQRMPQAVVLVREYVFDNENKDPQAKNPESPRQAHGPRDGYYGPR